ncbi:acyl-CoA dehydrogenase family protein [Actinomadura viridis]|uniref:acyl-CoA dehydrogenase family protein n=1 Tax=Actinomadura viridis TaxID=58110 RepID=UPI003694F19C
MNEIVAALTGTVGEACARFSSAEAVSAGGAWNARLWSALDQIGVCSIAVPEELGGAGGDLRTAVAVLETLGRYAAGVPLAEHALLAGWLLSECGAPVPPGPLTAAVAGPDFVLTPAEGGWSATGTLSRVPWARHAVGTVVLAGDHVVLLRPGDFVLDPGTNLAGEPRDGATLDGRIIPGDRVHGIRPMGAEAMFRDRAAVARVALMSGAAGNALDLTVAYAAEREQFGRPLAKFQAVQQHLAAMAGEVLLIKVAAEAAALAIDSGGDPAVPVAAARAAAGEAAGVVCTLAHQVHGAIGFTEEHPLRHSTTRLWAWRDEGGSESRWAARLGARVLEAAPGGLWPLLTGSE